MRKPGEEYRVRRPVTGELFAVVEQRLGYNKMYVRCQDNKIRIGRVPGKYSRRLWIREGDLVIIKLWEIEVDKKCDIIYRYTAAQKALLVQKKELPEDMQ
ncbi:MAG: translation initiation factor eIF-1A [Candidatus Altiarchaeota archaeon]|nr:translation initiation factor eIF-1A [Candidatus Altiarchaeota archaeon]